VQPPVPASTVSIGRGPRLRPPPSGAPSITKAWPLSVSATKLMPSGPTHSLCTPSSRAFLIDSRDFRLPDRDHIDRPVRRHRLTQGKAQRFDRLDRAFDSNKLNLLIILMVPELVPVFVSHRTKIFLHCTNSAFIMSSCRALEVLRALDEFCLLHPPPLVDLAQPFEVALFFGERSPLK